MDLEFVRLAFRVFLNKLSFKKLSRKKISLGTSAVFVLAAGLLAGVVSGLLLTVVAFSFRSLPAGLAPLLGSDAGTLLTPALRSGLLDLAVSGLLIAPVSVGFNWVFFAGLIFMFSYVFGGRKQFGPFLVLVSFIVVSSTLVSTFLDFLTLWDVVGAFLADVSTMIVSVWGLVLTSFAVKDYFSFSTRKAVSITFLPLVLLLSLALIRLLVPAL